MTNAPRGLRIHNPGHIERKGDIKWMGMAAEQPDSRFVAFISPEYGIRAIAKVMLTYRSKHHIVTVRKIIERWAPPDDDNPTLSYAHFVANKVGVEPDETIDVRDYDTMRPLVEAIIRFELGQMPYACETIDKGLALAGIRPANVA